MPSSKTSHFEPVLPKGYEDGAKEEEIEEDRNQEGELADDGEAVDVIPAAPAPIAEEEHPSPQN